MIAGPTASGKSALALALSRLVPATIINADASQVYADLRVLSARPDASEEAQAPHRLFGTLDGSVNCTAAHWATLAHSAIEEATEQRRLPILVGGTGLYLRTLLDGIAPVPEIDPAIRTEVRALPVSEAYRALQSEDPAAAERLNAADSTRVARALEVVRATGRTLADWQSLREGGIAGEYSVRGLILLPPRDWLRTRCDARFEAMLEAGAVEEVRALLARGLPRSLPVMRAIGVREITALLADPACRAAAIESAKAATRQYAKRQYTWFRHQPPPEWERIEQVLNDKNVNKIAIKLHDMLLTR